MMRSTEHSTQTQKKMLSFEHLMELSLKLDTFQVSTDTRKPKPKPKTNAQAMLAKLVRVTM